MGYAPAVSRIRALGSQWKGPRPVEITKEAVAGTLESSDARVTVSPNDTLDIAVESAVIQQFGDQIRRTVSETLAELGVSKGSVAIEDKGALDCVIKARVQASVLRGAGSDELDWEKLS